MLTQDLFYYMYIVQILLIRLYKADFIMAFVAQVSNVAHGPLVLPYVEKLTVLSIFLIKQCCIRESKAVCDFSFFFKLIVFNAFDY